VLDMMLLYRQTVLPIHGYSEYNTLDASVCDENDFWTVGAIIFGLTHWWVWLM